MALTNPLPEGAAIVVLGPRAQALAGLLKRALPGARIHGYRARIQEADVLFADVAEHLAGLYERGVPIVGLCAAGIIVRAVAPRVRDKASEPAVVAVAADGSAAVPLLGAHNGANALARAIAQAMGGTAALTTASESALGLALDDPPAGWHVANRDSVARVTAALLAGEAVALEVEAGDAAWILSSGARFDGAGPARVLVTDRSIQAGPDTFVLHPPVLALGVGCERGADGSELIGLVEETLARHGLARQSVACLASIALKAGEPALHGLAGALGVPARFFDAARLEAETPRLANPSESVFRETGCHGVAEGAALAAAGPGGALIVPKVKSRRATCAIARAPRDIAPERVGRARGRLYVVGIGPGDEGWRSAEAGAALALSSDVVGYGLYIELLGDAVAGKTLHPLPIGEEDARARLALDLAAEGRAVALVSSGDPGIYAMAALVFERIEREASRPWDSIEVVVVPGISAMQAAAARAGAPLGHDFAAVSLSDLLTPWAEIERRVEAAAAADFVLCLYNPVSLRRQGQLLRAREILLVHRPADTPVVLARNLGRRGESVEPIRLGDLVPERLDMLSIAIVGNSRTRLFERGRRTWVYTPRGYGAERARDA